MAPIIEEENLNKKEKEAKRWHINSRQRDAKVRDGDKKNQIQKRRNLK